VAVDLPLEGSFLSRLELGLQDVFTGARYAVEDNSIALPAHHLVGGHAGAEWNLWALTMKAIYRIHNILNARYEIVPRYPMPRISHSISLSISKTY
jgi:hypothetical protein